MLDEEVDESLNSLAIGCSTIKLDQSMICHHLESYNTYATQFGQTICELDDLSAELNQSSARFDETIGSNLILKEEIIEELHRSTKLISEKRANWEPTGISSLGA